MLLTVVLKKTLEGPLDCKEIQPVHPKGDQSLVFIGRTDVGAEVPIPRPPDVMNWRIRKAWCWDRLKAGGERDSRWDGWMALPTEWTWVWASSGRWWRTGKPGMLQSMGSQTVGHNLATEQQQIQRIMLVLASAFRLIKMPWQTGYYYYYYYW